MIHTLPILWNVTYLTRITMQFHCIPQWYVLCFTFIFSNCCLQYASVLQAGIVFHAINWLLFFYNSEKKGPLLVVIATKHSFTTTQNTKPLHIYARQTITNCPTVYHLLWGRCLLQCRFPTRKKLAFLQKFNQLSSEICDFLGLYTVCNGNSYHHCPAWPLNMGPEGCPKLR